MTRVLYVTMGEGLSDGLMRSQVEAVLEARHLSGDEVMHLALVPAHKIVRGGASPKVKYRRVVIPVPYRNLWIWPRQAERLGRVTAGVLRLLGLSTWDVVHCRSYPAALVGAAIGERLKVSRRVFDPRGIYPEEAGKVVASKGQQFIDAWNLEEARLLGSFDSLICVSDRMREHFLQKHGVLPDHTSVVPCSGGGRILERVDRSDRQEVVVCYCGSVGTWTALDDIADAYAAVDRALSGQTQLRVIGSGDPSVLIGKVSRLLGRNPIVTQTAVDQRKVFEELARCDVGLLPRSPSLVNRVSWPAKLSEYLLAGLKVATNLEDSNIAEVLDRYDARFHLDPGRAAAAKAEEFLDDEAKVRVARAVRAGEVMGATAVVQAVADIWEGQG